MFLRNSWLLVPVANLGRFLPIKYHLGDIQPCPDSPMSPPQKKKNNISPLQQNKETPLAAAPKEFCFTFSANLHHLRPSHASCSLQRASVHPSRVPCTNAWNDYHCHLRYDFVLVTSFGRHVGWWRDHPGDGRNDSDLLIQIRKKKNREQVNKHQKCQERDIRQLENPEFFARFRSRIRLIDTWPFGFPCSHHTYSLHRMNHCWMPSCMAFTVLLHPWGMQAVCRG